jgi:hypothetical protein
MHQHDYQQCNCPNKTFTDGGTSYQRYGGVDMNNIHVRSIYLSDGFDTCRGVPIWGSKGKNGDEEFRYLAVYQMTDGHLEKLVDYIPEGWRLDLVKKEIEYRKKTNDRTCLKIY